MNKNSKQNVRAIKNIIKVLALILSPLLLGLFLLLEIVPTLSNIKQVEEFMTEKFVQTVSSVNYNKGVFSLYFVGQDQTKMSNGVMAENDNDLELKQVVHMPASGFMYMVSMVKNMLEDPRMSAEFDKLVTAGLLPAGEADANQVEELKTEEKSAPKKRASQAKK